MVGYKAGPIVTLYEFRPQSGVKSSRVIGLSSDIARMMLVGSVRISTITGKDTLGIEVPNNERSVVNFRNLIESKAYQNNPAILPLILDFSYAFLYILPILAIKSSSLTRERPVISLI